MIKVSFKGDEKTASKTVTRVNKALNVRLEGEFICPIWEDIPAKVKLWALTRPNVRICSYMGKSYLMVTGKATCHKGDTFDYVVGERIAEARAKIKLYAFLAALCNKAARHYLGLVFGEHYPNLNTERMSLNDSLSRDLKKYQNLWKHELEHLDSYINGLKKNPT